MEKYGVVGLGRMGGSLVQNLLTAGGEAVVFDIDPRAVAELAAKPGVTGVTELSRLVAHLQSPRVIWMMVPAGEPVDHVVAELLPQLAAGDVLIDGGNSYWKDSMRRAAQLKEQGIRYLDCGTSGGMEGALHGLCLMIGGEAEAFALAEPLFKAIACTNGYAHVGPSGAGHFVKMVHNGVEYGLLQAIGEGFELLDAGPFQLDLHQVADLWNHGSVVRSWLMALIAHALAQDPHLEQIQGAVGGGSTGSWAIEAGWAAGVPMPVIAAAYTARLRSRQQDTFTGKVVAALRREFGGHAVTTIPER